MRAVGACPAMKTYIGILVIFAALGGLGVWLWVKATPAQRPTALGRDTAPAPAATQAERVLRLDITPERNPVQMKRRYDSLAQYLTDKMDRRVELSVVNTYQAVLADLADKEADGAFVGSMVGALALDRLGARVLVKPQTFDGVSTYRGVVFVPETSRIRSVDDLAGHTLAMVRATTAGDLFPILLLREAHLLDRADGPRLVYCGSHDDAIQAVIDGQIDAGAVKDLRLAALLEANPAWKVRQLALSAPVPNNALILRRDVATELGPTLSAILLGMGDDPQGRKVLSGMGLERFVPCSAAEYGAVGDMAQRVGAEWRRVGVDGPAPHFTPAGAPAN